MSGLTSDPNFRFAATFLNRFSDKWAVIGGQVANEYRVATRFTQDYDFYVASLTGLREQLEKEGFELDFYYSKNEADRLGQIRASISGLRYDFNLIDYPPYHDALIERAQRNDGVAVIEDLLIMKFDAWRDRDRGDIRSVLRSQRPFDESLVREWSVLEAFDFDEKLDRELSYRDLCVAADARTLANGGAPLVEDQLFEFLYVNEHSGWRNAEELFKANPKVNLDFIRTRLELFGYSSRLDQLTRSIAPPGHGPSFKM